MPLFLSDLPNASQIRQGFKGACIGDDEPWDNVRACPPLKDDIGFVFGRLVSDNITIACQVLRFDFLPDDLAKRLHISVQSLRSAMTLIEQLQDLVSKVKPHENNQP
jgi:hypothetical protein